MIKFYFKVSVLIATSAKELANALSIDAEAWY